MLPAMKRETVLALNALNHAFYQAIAPEWSESRRHAWPGFDRVCRLLRAEAHGVQPLRVLDVGAGDGRFAQFLKEQRQADASAPFEYLGIDASERLLAHARARELGSYARFERADFLEAGALPAGPFDLVVLFGILHHVPSFERRCELLAEVAQRVAPGGLLALTFWRLDRDPRFSKRVRSFAEYNRRATAVIDETDLEPGDTLLSWADQDAVRYCHFPDARETEALIAAAQLPVLARFEADGRGDALNEYVVFIARQG
jgi:tRNA (uracil-5-)-methyltransferase TRM9